MKKFCVFLILLLIFATPLRAEISFETTVNVETEAENQALAKDMALKQAYRKAFLEIGQKMATSKQYALLESLNDDQLAHFIRETSVISEGGSGKSYHAELNVAVNGALLKDFLAENDAVDIAIDNRVLVIPALDGLDALKPKAENPWLQAWLEKGPIAEGQLVFEVWPKDLTEADTYDYLKQESGIPNIYAAYATVLSPQEVIIRLVELRSGISERFQASVQEGDVFNRTIAEVVRRISRKRPAPQAPYQVEDGTLTVVYHYNRLKDWLDTKEKLKSVESIKKVETGGLGGGKVQMKLEYKGTLEALKSALAQKQLSLEEQENFYILR